MTLNSTGNYTTAPSGITADLSGRTVVNGAGGTDTLAPGVTTIIGSAHNDDFVASTGDGSWTINGEGGTNLLAVYNAGRSQAQITNDAAGVFDLTITGTAIHAINVDQINFIDGTVEYDPGSTAALIVRLYQAALDQPPDPAGLAGWTNLLNSGTSLDSIADSFLNSPQFQAEAPGAATNPTEFITALWQNVFHSAPDPQNLAAWVNVLTSGEQTQAQVLISFSQSAQNYTNTASEFTSGIFVANEQAAQVARLYYSVLDRPPDLFGLSAATYAMESGSESLQQVAAALIASPEFQGKYGTLTNLGFVDTIYSNVYGVAPDPTTAASSVAALNAGTQTRASLTVGFSESLQHVLSMAPVIEANGIKFE